MFSSKNFDVSFYDSILELREFDVVLKFKDDYHTEKSLMDFLDSLGFRITDNGYKYLISIISDALEKDLTFPNVKVLYDRCAEKYSVTPKSVETSIANAIKTAGKSGKLSKINSIFNTEHVENGYISNAMFISDVCRRFYMLKKYDKEIHFSV